MKHHFSIIVLTAVLFTSCYQVPTTYIKRCKNVKVESQDYYRKYKRNGRYRYKYYKGKVKLCRECDFKGNCWTVEKLI